MATYTTTFDVQVGKSNEPLKVTFEYGADFTGDGKNDVRVTFDLTAVDPPNSGTEDVIGVAFDIAGDAVAGLNVTDITRTTYFGTLSSFTPTVVIGANKVSDSKGFLDPGFSTSGGSLGENGEPYDVGIQFSKEGTGEGIVQKASFVLSTPGSDIDAEALLDGTDWWVRLQSTDGGADSAKTAEFDIDLPPPPDGGNDTIGIAIEKRTLDGIAAAATIAADFANAGDGDTILAGESVTWIYAVSSTGTLDLSGITVGDNQPDVAPAYLTGDDGDNVLESGETWYYTAAGTAVVGDYANKGTASGKNGATTVSEFDTSSYFGANPQIGIEKRTLDGNAAAATIAADYAAAGDGATVLAGENVTWIYAVTNEGNVDLSGVDVDDDQVGVTPVYLAGDDGDNVLESGETWYYTAAGTAVVGDYANKGTASGSFTDTAGHVATPTASDTSSYFGADPSISIEKKTAVGSAEGDGLGAIAGQAITWKYYVTADGNVPVSDVTVKDDNGTPGNTADDFFATYASGDDGDDILELGETWVFTKAGIAGANAYTNIGTASGKFTDTAGHSAPVTDTDSSGYVGFDTNGLTPGFWSNHLQAWDGAADSKWQKLVNSGVLTRLDVLPTGVDSNGDGYVNAYDKGVLIGDADGNGITGIGETTLFIPLAAAQKIINSSESATDARQILARQAIAAQLNVYNGNDNPADLVGEAAKWLKGLSPYQYGDGSSGKIDTNGNGRLDAAEYSISSKGAFSFTSAALASSKQAWGRDVDVYDPNDGNDWDNSAVLAGNQEAGGEDLKNALQAFNENRLLSSADGQYVGYYDSGTNSVESVMANSLDAFWLVLHDQGLV